MNSQLLFSHSVMSDSLGPHGLQHARLPCPSPSPGTCSKSCPLIWWCYAIISSSVIPFSCCLKSFPASGSFLMSWLFISVHQIIEASASASVLTMNIQHWFNLGWTGLISLLSILCTHMPVKVLSDIEITVPGMGMEVQETPFRLILHPHQAHCSPADADPVLGPGLGGSLHLSRSQAT